MTFEEILDQALAMLQRRGRVTYRTLQRQFNLDDAALEDLKEALLYAHPHVADDPGHGMLWRGETTSTPPPGPAALQPDPRLAAEDLHSTPAEPSPRGPHTPDAERRQLTVLFCDLVDSTVLASQLDPEEWREVVRAYQDTCAKVIQRYDGYIAQYLGDGLLVYFGYPQAHEDDARRAVQAGLGMVEAVNQLSTRLSQERGVSLAVRLGIHTGQVVVGEIGGGAMHEQLALGETPNLAARLQGLAVPNTLVISAATYQLLGGFFACQSLGPHLLKGLPQPTEVYQVLYESMAGSVANFDFRGKIRKSALGNSMAYRRQNSRKSNFATEPESAPVMEPPYRRDASTARPIQDPRGRRWHASCCAIHPPWSP